METMRIAVFTGVRQIQVETCARPKATGNKALVKIEATAICTWEQRVYTGVNSVEFPFIGGHEIAGYIVAMGEDMNRQEWAIGDRVVIGATLQCRNCLYCKEGHSECCPHFNHSAHLEGMPYRGMGGLSEYMLAPADCLFKYDHVTAEEASIIEPVSCVVHSMEIANPALGDIVLIIGSGIMGLLHVQLATRRGASVIVSDPNEERLAIAKRMGAKYVINPLKEDLPARVLEITKDMKAQIVFDATPLPRLIGDAFSCVANAGKVILYSSMHPADSVPFDPNWIHGKSIQILGTANSNDRDFVRASRLVSQGIIDMKPFISATYPLDCVRDAFEEAIKGQAFRVVVKFS